MITTSTNIPKAGLNQFTSDLNLYELNIQISDGEEHTDFLDTSTIEMFSYNNKMNRLYLTGYLDYVDVRGSLINYIHTQLPIIDVSLELKKQNKCGGVQTEESKKKIEMTFFVDSVEILSNIPGLTKYRLNLIGLSYLALCQSVSYNTRNKSNKHKGQELTQTEIIQDILENSGFKIDKDSFENNKSTKKHHYITNLNDNYLSVIDYLLNYSVYDPNDYDKQLKALVIDESNVIHLKSLGVNGNPLGVHIPLTINTFKNEQFPGYSSPTQIGYTNQFSRPRAINNTRSMTYHTYDLETGQIGNSTLKTQDIIDIINGGVENQYPIYNNVLVDTFSRQSMTWNHKINLYQQIFETLTQTNGLITNQVGFLGVIPGCTTNLTIPQNIPSSKNKTQDNYIKNLYNSFSGDWDVVEVEHYILPGKNIFRQKLVLYHQIPVNLNKVKK